QLRVVVVLQRLYIVHGQVEGLGDLGDAQTAGLALRAHQRARRGAGCRVVNARRGGRFLAFSELRSRIFGGGALLGGRITIRIGTSSHSRISVLRGLPVTTEVRQCRESGLD